MKKHRRRLTTKRKRFIMLNSLLVLFLVLGLGYSMLSTNLSILGNITLKTPVCNTNGKLYNVLKCEAENNGLAKEYTGAHHDSFTEEPSKKIYHWYADNDTEGTSILDKNNVIFAGRCWQMIRTTDTGGVKIQYNGEPTLGTSNGKTTYDCGTSRPYHIGGIKTTLSLNGTYLYGTGYTTSVSGSTTTFTLTNTESVQVTSSNAATVIPTLAGKYTCRNTTGTCTNASLYKVDSQSSSYNAYVYRSTYRDSIGTSAFNSNSNSVGDVGYMYNKRYDLGEIPYIWYEPIDGYSEYLIGDDIQDNGDGTVTLIGENVNVISGYTLGTDLSNYLDKYLCMPGHFTRETNTCSDDNYNSIALMQLFPWASEEPELLWGTPIIRYGYGIEADGNSYKLVAKSGEPRTLQYITSYNAYLNGNYSHYTCNNLSGKCDNYYYIFSSDSWNSYYTISISDGKYVSTDLNDTNNILYEMLNASNLNTTNSTIKTTIDSWYENNLLNTSYANLIDTSTIFCNDRSIKSFGGWNPDGGSITADLTFTEYTSTNNLNCNRSLDAFSTTNASAHLSYPIGLMSSPEMNILGNNTVRSTAYGYWLGSPSYFDHDYVYAGGRYVNTAGSFIGSNVYSTYGVRPAVSLRSGTEYSSGDGSMANPYVVG